jgi:hypothetical protein
MSYQRERDQFIATMAKHGMHVDTARLILRHAQTYHRLSERECNGDDWQINALVPCPEWRKRFSGHCATCGVSNLAVAAPASPRYHGHSKVSRSSVRMGQIERRIAVLVEACGDMRPDFNGDPRGYTVRILTRGVAGPYIGVPTRSR